MVDDDGKKSFSYTSTDDISLVNFAKVVGARLTATSARTKTAKLGTDEQEVSCPTSPYSLWTMNYDAIGYGLSAVGAGEAVVGTLCSLVP